MAHLLFLHVIGDLAGDLEGLAHSLVGSTGHGTTLGAGMREMVSLCSFSQFTIIERIAVFTAVILVN